MFAALLLATATIVPSGQSFECVPTRVWDADGPIWCSNGVRIRLAGIAAREIDETCRRGHPCPQASGIEARDYLISLLGTRGKATRHGHITVSASATLSCTSTGSADGSRTGAWCYSPIAGDLSCAMVRSGYAARWDRYWGSHQC